MPSLLGISQSAVPNANFGLALSILATATKAKYPVACCRVFHFPSLWSKEDLPSQANNHQNLFQIFDSHYSRANDIAILHADIPP